LPQSEYETSLQLRNAAPSQELLVIRHNYQTGEVSLDPPRWGSTLQTSQLCAKQVVRVQRKTGCPCAEAGRNTLVRLVFYKCIVLAERVRRTSGDEDHKTDEDSGTLLVEMAHDARARGRGRGTADLLRAAAMRYVDSRF
jgi:hypothetical protein